MFSSEAWGERPFLEGAAGKTEDRKVSVSDFGVNKMLTRERDSLLDGVGLGGDENESEEEREGRSVGFERRRKKDSPQSRIDIR